MIGIHNLEPKYTNIALEKIRMYYTRQGEIVEDYLPLKHEQYDKIYCSSIFTYTDKRQVPNNAICGGSGFDLMTVLPAEIEDMKPKINIGFTTRGCIRNCPFCIVPQKEGSIKAVGDIYDIWDGYSNSIVLLDNNILALGWQFDEITNQIKKNNLKVDFNQGLDIRLLRKWHIERLKELKPLKQWRFAFDSFKYEKAFRKGAETLIKGGISKSLICVYVLVGYDDTPEEAMEKINIVYNEYGFDPFVMIYRDQDGFYNSKYKKLRKWGRDFKDFARWVNHKAIFKSVNWQDYKKQKVRV